LDGGHAKNDWGKNYGIEPPTPLLKKS
jgi:hypothetical protein